MELPFLYFLFTSLLGFTIPARAVPGAISNNSVSSDYAAATISISISINTTTSSVNSNISSASNDTWMYTPPGKNYTTVTIRDKATNEVYNVTYRVNNFGEVIYFDDNIWGPEDLLLSSQVSATTPQKRWYSVRSKYGWPDATVHYKYDSSNTKSVLKGVVDNALDEWRKHAPYLTFIEDPVGTLFGVGVVTITSTANDGCYSNVGLVSFKPHINLQNPGCNLVATALHEWGHQLGLRHEHQRPDRENYVRFNCHAVQPEESNGCTASEAAAADCCVDTTSKCCSKLSNFDKMTFDIFQMGKDYDITSIMQYQSKSFNRPNQYTLVRVSDPSREIPAQTGLSSGDAEGMCNIYRPFCDAYKVSDNGRKLNYTSGWVFGTNYSSYSSFNDWSLYPAPDTMYVNVTGIRTVNTKCLSVAETSDNENSTAFSVVPAGTTFSFMTDIDFTLLRDTCCVRYYSDDKCDEMGTYRTECDSLNKQTAIDIRSWRVFNCTGIWTGPPK